MTIHRLALSRGLVTSTLGVISPGTSAWRWLLADAEGAEDAAQQIIGAEGAGDFTQLFLG